MEISQYFCLDNSDQSQDSLKILIDKNFIYIFFVELFGK